MNQERIGKLIKDLRVKNNLTQKELADKLGVTFQAVSKWENGKNIPDISTIHLICEVFNIDVNEILSGVKHKKRKKLKFILIIALGILLAIAYFLFFNNSDFQFKTITTSCENFNITGSAAFNRDKTYIYISNINYCGEEDKLTYKNITCSLYETAEDIDKKISSCESKENVTLNEYLKNIEINVNHSSKVCKDFTHANLFLEINASVNNDKITTYRIPIVLKDNCK